MIHKRALLATSAATLAMLAAPVLAQDTFEDEIIVTATKRPTTLQDTPIAVQVTNSEVIEKAQILDLKDLQTVVPTLRISTLQNANQSNFIIRGFGNGANNPGIEPSVGVFIDGVYRSRAAAQIGDLPNVERVEVISGPQSTLFGKNASVGVISVVTSEPQFENSGFVELGYGNYNQLLGKAYVTGGLSENVAGALSVTYNERDGYFTDIVSGDDYNSRQRFSVRGDLLWAPTDQTEFRLVGDYQNIDDQCCGVVLTDVIDANPAVGRAQTGSALFLAQAGLLGLRSNNPADPFGYLIALNQAPTTEVDDYGISLHAEHNFDNGIDLTSITSYRVNDSLSTLDADFSNVNFLTNDSGADIDTFTQEIRLSTTLFEDRGSLLLSGFYFNEDIDSAQNLTFQNDARPLFAALVGSLQGGTPADGEAAFALLEAANGLPNGSSFAGGTRIDETFTLENESFSLFGNFDYDLTDRFTVSLGAAYIDDQKNFTGSSVNNDQFSNLDLFGSAASNAATLQGTATAFPGVAAGCGLGALPFSPANVAAVSGVASCPGLGGVPGAAAFAGLQAQVAAGVGALDFTNPAQNPFSALSGLQFLPQFFALPNSLEDGQTNDSQTTFSVKGSYELTDRVNVYASYSTGFKASSINLSRDSRPVLTDFVDGNGRPIAANFALLPNNYSVRLTTGQLITNTTADADIPANAQVAVATARNFGTRAADPEETTNIEAGIKTTFDGGYLNLTAFRTSVEGFQSNAFVGSGFVLTNAGEQISTGFEWDMGYRPVDALQLAFAGAYVDAEYEDFRASPDLFSVPVNRSGDTVAGISPWTITASATYEHDFANNWGGFLRGDFIYESSTPITDVQNDFDSSNNTVNGTPILSTAGFANLEREVFTVNFGAGLNFNNGFELQAYLRNAFNDEYLQSAFDTPGLFGLARGYPNQPRTYGIIGRYRF